MRPTISNADEAISITEEWLQFVARHVKSLRFGVVEVVVHNGRVVQVEKTERFRFDRSEPRSDG